LHVLVVVRLERMLKDVVFVYPAYAHLVASQVEVEDVLPRNKSPHLATGQADVLNPCVGWQSNLNGNYRAL
jgi:hypothetical protein